MIKTKKVGDLLASNNMNIELNDLKEAMIYNVEIDVNNETLCLNLISSNYVHDSEIKLLEDELIKFFKQF